MQRKCGKIANHSEPDLNPGREQEQEQEQEQQQEQQQEQEEVQFSIFNFPYLC
jgi:hypothetical protein